MDPYEEAERLLQEIESEFPPSKCSLAEYQSVLKALLPEIRDRIAQIDDEL